MESRVEIVQQQLVRYLETAAPSSTTLGADDPLRVGSDLTAKVALDVIHDQLLSRILDVKARELKAEGLGYYTISSAGHEQNAVVGAQLRLTDPCFLHYRSGGLMMARSRVAGDVDPIRDTLLSYVAGTDDPSSGGRHKVWGSLRMWVPPQTSTIASHLPKAVGMAFALGRRRRFGVGATLPGDAIVLCSFGDASTGHATALSAINAARYSLRRGSPTPVLFLCEDNGIGISVRQPHGWIEETFSQVSQLEYADAGGSVDVVWDRVQEAIRHCRDRRCPVFLRLPTIRLWGHAGSDVETTYRTLDEIEAIEAQDPLLANLRRLVETGAAHPRVLLTKYRDLTQQVDAATTHYAEASKLDTAARVVAPLAPYHADRCRQSASGTATTEQRTRLFGDELPENATVPTKRTLAAHINSALVDEMLRRPETVAFGEDVAQKGGVYHVTARLQNRLGAGRVFDTLLDETTILGMAQGMAQAGYLPIPEIQYLAYIHNALDQLRGEACSLSFFSNGQFRNPMVVRVAGFAYQKGFGGHFHNDHSIAALRDIPGLVLATPSRGDDAARLLRGLLAMAAEDGRVACFLEPIALYHEKDLYQPGDRGWLFDYPPPGDAILPGEVGIYHEDRTDLLVVSYANGLRLSLRAARQLKEEHQIAARVLDLRWLNPLPVKALRTHAEQCKSLLVVDECRAQGGVADAIIAHLAEDGYGRRMASVRALDTYIPLGPAADLVLVSEQQIVDRAVQLVRP